MNIQGVFVCGRVGMDGGCRGDWRCVVQSETTDMDNASDIKDE